MNYPSIGGVATNPFKLKTSPDNLMKPPSYFGPTNTLSGLLKPSLSATPNQGGLDIKSPSAMSAPPNKAALHPLAKMLMLALLGEQAGPYNSLK